MLGLTSSEPELLIHVLFISRYVLHSAHLYISAKSIGLKSKNSGPFGSLVLYFPLIKNNK